MEHTLMDTLEIRTQVLHKDLVVLTMPVDGRTHQPAGFLHGGANVALAETAASLGALQHIDQAKYQIFGIEINANHVKAKRSGLVTAKATPLHCGTTTMVWEVRIVDEEDTLLCISRSTIGIIPKKK